MFLARGFGKKENEWGCGMSPLKSQVSFSKERNFPFLRRSESLKERKDGAGCESEKRKERGRRSKDRKRSKSKDKKDVSLGTLDPSSDKLNQQAVGFAASLAATLSPLSTFVSAHSPRLSRRGSPSPGRSPSNGNSDGFLSLPETPLSKTPTRSRKSNITFSSPQPSEKVRRKTLKSDSSSEATKNHPAPIRAKSLSLKISQNFWNSHEDENELRHHNSKIDSATGRGSPRPTECSPLTSDDDDDHRLQLDIPTVTVDCVDENTDNEASDVFEEQIPVKEPLGEDTAKNCRILPLTISDDWEDRLATHHVAKHE